MKTATKHRLKIFAAIVGVPIQFGLIYYMSIHLFLFMGLFFGKALYFFYFLVFLTLGFCLNIIETAYKSIDREFTEYHNGQRRFSSHHAALQPAMLLGLFVATSMLGRAHFGESFLVVPEQLDVWWDLPLYGLDNFIRAVLWDFAEIYRLDLSEIEHGDGFWATTFVFVVRTSLAISFLSYVIAGYKAFKQYR